MFLMMAGCAYPAEVADMPTARGSMTAWAPEAVPPWAVVVALHGFNDHKGSYAPFGAYAARRGVRVEAYDQAGFGARDRPGIWAGTERLVQDLHEHVRDARRRYPGVPVYVLGESMGSAVAIVAAAAPDVPPIDGVILTSPAVWGGQDLPQGYRTTLAILAALVPPLKVTGGHFDILASDNIDMLRALGRDPLYIRSTRIDAVAGLVRLMDQAWADGPALRQRLLVLRGARDEVVSPRIQADFVRELRDPDCLTATYLNGWHLLLRDLQRQRVFDDILAWIGHEPLPSGLEVACGRPDAATASVAGGG